MKWIIASMGRCQGLLVEASNMLKKCRLSCPHNDSQPATNIYNSHLYTYVHRTSLKALHIPKSEKLCSQTYRDEVAIVLSLYSNIVVVASSQLFWLPVLAER